MNRNLYFAGISFVLSACASPNRQPSPDLQREDVNAQAQGSYISIPEFLVLSKVDLDEMKKTQKKGRPFAVTLNNKPAGRCDPAPCEVKGPQKLELNATAMGKILDLHAKALKYGVEQKFMEGPATVRCIPHRCVVDLRIDSSSPQEFNEKSGIDLSLYPTGDIRGTFLGQKVGDPEEKSP